MFQFSIDVTWMTAVTVGELQRGGESCGRAGSLWSLPPSLCSLNPPLLTSLMHWLYHPVSLFAGAAHNTVNPTRPVGKRWQLS